MSVQGFEGGHAGTPKTAAQAANDRLAASEADQLRHWAEAPSVRARLDGGTPFSLDEMAVRARADQAGVALDGPTAFEPSAARQQCEELRTVYLGGGSVAVQGFQQPIAPAGPETSF